MNAIVDHSTQFDYSPVVNTSAPHEWDEFSYDGDNQVLSSSSAAPKTVWMVYDRTFDDGQTEICVSKSYRFKDSYTPTKHAKRGESENKEANQEDAAARARQKVRLNCKAISADRMITLTYRENMQDVVRLKKDWDVFRRKMSKHKVFHYVAVVEQQERGAFHIHIAVNGRQSYHLVRSIWTRIVGTDEQGRVNGNIDVRNPQRFGGQTKNARHKIAAYIAKYIAEEMTVREFNGKRYWASRGIVVPEKVAYQLPYGTDQWGAFAHALKLACDRGIEGANVWQNQGMGVLWMATAAPI
ncbi:rolling circle replication-associated protein [Glaciimonas soli]|uniref:Replication-associated protein ORF2/G2P domain-containing protein n=1 Tax=Glaciimonas soli TaxID=2590999 RepID=A0A843YIR5_9BURK|nr:hypothetical protein [Glaciimonas soli]MQQ99254.1 hypothetical protein [Glaciimonas soli]